MGKIVILVVVIEEPGPQRAMANMAAQSLLELLDEQFQSRPDPRSMIINCDLSLVLPPDFVFPEKAPKPYGRPPMFLGREQNHTRANVRAYRPQHRGYPNF